MHTRYLKLKVLSILLIANIICHAQPAYKWVKGIGGLTSDGGRSITTDAAGNIYTTGLFSATVDFDPGPGTAMLTAAGIIDIFISKTDASGNLIWAKAIGGAREDMGYSIAVDGSGNVYTTGQFKGTVDFDPGPGTYNLTSGSSDNYDVFISKLDASGNFVWAKSVGSSFKDVGYAISVDNSGNVYTTGEYSGTVDFDPGPGTYNITAAGTDIFVLKLDASGNFIWATGLGGNDIDTDMGYGIVVDNLGNVYTTGFFNGTIEFDPGSGTQTIVSSDSNDIFISRLDATGKLVWAKGMGASFNDIGYSIAIDNQGNVYTTGQFKGTVDFDPGPGTHILTSASLDNYDIFISKLDASGNFIWATGLGGSDNDIGYSIAVDNQDNVYTTGFFNGTVDFDPGTGTQNLVSSGKDDIFISQLDASGNFVWAKHMGGAGSDISYSIAVDGSGNVFTTGFFEQTADFDPDAGTQNLTSAGQQDIFISKLGLSPLPLSLLNFYSVNNNDAIAFLYWQSTQDQNTSFYIIERSTDGRQFAAIGSVPAIVNSSSINNYSFSDEQPFNGTNYYRLKMTDINGQFTYSPIVAVKIKETANTLQLFPNPVKEIMYVEANGHETVNLLITDATGRLVKQRKILLNGNTTFSVNVHNLAPGNYYLRLQGKQIRDIQQIIKL